MRYLRMVIWNYPENSEVMADFYMPKNIPVISFRQIVAYPCLEKESNIK